MENILNLLNQQQVKDEILSTISINTDDGLLEYDTEKAIKIKNKYKDLSIQLPSITPFGVLTKPEKLSFDPSTTVSDLLTIFGKLSFFDNQDNTSLVNYFEALFNNCKIPIIATVLKTKEGILYNKTKTHLFDIDAIELTNENYTKSVKSHLTDTVFKICKLATNLEEHVIYLPLKEVNSIYSPFVLLIKIVDLNMTADEALAKYGEETYAHLSHGEYLKEDTNLIAKIIEMSVNAYIITHKQ